MYILIHTGCIDDCSAAISLLTYVPPKVTDKLSNSSSTMLESLLPPFGSEKRKNWLLKTVMRRGDTMLLYICNASAH